MPRAIWSGAITFGLVHVPVKMYPAQKQKDVRFNQIEAKTGARVRNQRVSEKTGKEVPYEEVVKGYDVGEGHYVLLSDDDLGQFAPDTTHTIDIEDFVPLEQIDPISFEKAYWLAPAPGGEKAYALLANAMAEEGRVAIGRVVIRTKQYLAVIRPVDGCLVLETMLYPDEIVEPDKIEGLPVKGARISDRERTMARQLIEQMASDFEPDKYRDEYREHLLEFIDKKAAGEEWVTEPAKEEGAPVLDLMEALKASVDASKKGKKRAS